MTMITSPDLLRRDVVKVLRQITAQIEEVEAEAERVGSSPEKMRNHDGSYVMPPLLLAKVQALATLAQLNANARR